MNCKSDFIFKAVSESLKHLLSAYLINFNDYKHNKKISLGVYVIFMSWTAQGGAKHLILWSRG